MITSMRGMCTWFNVSLLKCRSFVKLRWCLAFPLFFQQTSTFLTKRYKWRKSSRGKGKRAKFQKSEWWEGWCKGNPFTFFFAPFQTPLWIVCASCVNTARTWTRWCRRIKIDLIKIGCTIGGITSILLLNYKKGLDHHHHHRRSRKKDAYIHGNGWYT